MDIINFRTFLAAAELGSFSAAAKRVNASPSSVTERIARLEGYLGTRLFKRGRSGCTLTAAGQRFVEPARRMADQWHLAQLDLSGPGRSVEEMAIGAQTAFWPMFLHRWLATARRQHPEIGFRASAGASHRLNRDLIDGKLDCILTYQPVFRPGIANMTILDDYLVLVSGGDVNDWKSAYVDVDWGETATLQIGSLEAPPPPSNLTIQLGALSARWLVDEKMSGFMPSGLIAAELAAGILRRVDEVPAIPFPAYCCYRRAGGSHRRRDVVRSIADAAALVTGSGRD